MYLGFAAGVGKTYQMLADAHELVKRGVDLVIGYLEPHGRKDTIAQALGLELIPRCKMEYRGAVFEEMDLPPSSNAIPRCAWWMSCRIPTSRVATT